MMWVHDNDPESTTSVELQINTHVMDGKPLDRKWVTVLDSTCLNFSYQLSDVLMWKSLAEQHGWAIRFIHTNVIVSYHELEEVLDQIQPASAPCKEAWDAR